MDDILDFTENSETLGKPAMNDLRSGIATAPVGSCQIVTDRESMHMTHVGMKSKKRWHCVMCRFYLQQRSFQN